MRNVCGDHRGMTMKHLSVAGLLALLLCACTVSFNPPSQQQLPESTAGTPAEQQEALAAAQVFIGMIDRGDYDAIWLNAGPSLRDATNETAFIMTLKLAKKAFTLLPGREPESMGFNTQAEPGGPVGEYVMVQFVARAGDLTATERVVMQKEQGRWKIIGYFINKRSQTQIMGSR